MEELEKDVKTIIENEENERLFMKLQSKTEQEGKIPKSSFLFLDKFRGLFEYSAGICIGCFTGIFVLIINFILFILAMHLEM